MTRDKCLTCRRRAEVRGLCHKCYQSARYAIKKNKIQERALIDGGLLLPKGATAKSDFGALLKELMRKEPCRENQSLNYSV